MLLGFSELTEQIFNKLLVELVEIFDIAKNSQRHSGDLLLARNNAKFRPDVFGRLTNSQQNYIPTAFGPQEFYYCFDTQHSYMYEARKLLDDRFFSGSKLAFWDRRDLGKRASDIDDYALSSALLIYMKIFEDYQFIGFISSFCDIFKGQVYNYKLGLMPIENLAPKMAKMFRNYSILSDIFSTVYSKNLRNSIAHGQFVVGEDRVGFYNSMYIQHSNLSYSEVIVMVAKAFALWNAYQYLLIKIDLEYAYRQFLNQDNLVLLKLESGLLEECLVWYRFPFLTWTFKSVMSPDELRIWPQHCSNFVQLVQKYQASNPSDPLIDYYLQMTR